MHINATFLIQIINFIITYYVLNTFLFKPIIKSLKRKQEKETALKTSIEKEEENILTLEKKKHEKVLSFQRKMKKEFPYIAPVTPDKPIDIEVDITKATPDKALQKEVTNLLVKRVPDAY
jgi:hypothetical protein